ncbi:hypothetical protein DFJ58DRAFT_174002 [Suillus subalutaceus]|uniref:uncharacterized protein n=1 Tax=Suillus subalutaceus TaxID=48586 RepID=UPI001B883B68|nr:uncharacterized protein DFJ58DRAFT_174002 [Suillus subalutaceus]KAG1836269.1 hypothetical protein DFJ58DRAFT_174002 [Suillus subalutaceus]
MPLEAQHAHALESTWRETPRFETPPSPTPIPPLRYLSPASSSSSSSLSITSTRTVPASPRPKLTRQQFASSTSAVLDSTVSRSPCHRYNQSMPRGSSSSVRISRVPPVDDSLATAQPPTSLALIRSYSNHYFTANRIATLSVLFFLIPIMSLILRRWQRLETPLDLVQRRLSEARGDSIARRLWNELVRAIFNTVRMGGGGLAMCNLRCTCLVSVFLTRPRRRVRVGVRL